MLSSSHQSLKVSSHWQVSPVARWWRPTLTLQWMSLRSALPGVCRICSFCDSILALHKRVFVFVNRAFYPKCLSSVIFFHFFLLFSFCLLFQSSFCFHFAFSFRLLSLFILPSPSVFFLFPTFFFFCVPSFAVFVFPFAFFFFLLFLPSLGFLYVCSKCHSLLLAFTSLTWLRYAKQKFGWGREKVDNVLDPMMKELTKKMVRGQHSLFLWPLLLPCAYTAGNIPFKES